MTPSEAPGLLNNDLFYEGEGTTWEQIMARQSPEMRAKVLKIIIDEIAELTRRKEFIEKILSGEAPKP